MDDIIEFANENLEGDLDADILQYSSANNRQIPSSSGGWEVTGISHLLNSVSHPSSFSASFPSMESSSEKMNSGSENTEDDFPSSSSSSHPSCSDDSNTTSSSMSPRRKRTRTDPLNKKKRIDYKNPYHAERLNIAIASVIAALRGDPAAFHKNITSIAKQHDIPYNTLRDNVLRARGIEPRAHRNSEKKRQAEAVAAAAERGVEYKAHKGSTLQIQTARASIHIGDALELDPEDPGPLIPVTIVNSNLTYVENSISSHSSERNNNNNINNNNNNDNNSNNSDNTHNNGNNNISHDRKRMKTGYSHPKVEIDSDSDSDIDDNGNNGNSNFPAPF